MKCEEDVKKTKRQEIENFGEYCNCSWPCDDVTYSTDASSAVWPSKNSLKSFLQSVIETAPNTKAYKFYQNLKSKNASNEEIYSWVQKHFLNLNVFANSNVVSVTSEIPKYTVSDLFCNVGGCLGLWVGMSVITLVETMDLIVKVLNEILFSSYKSKVVVPK